MTANLTIGSDPPASAGTKGYALNHLALVVYDFDSMLRFYQDILGMRHVMTINISEAYKITYLGYPAGDSDFQTGEELHKQMRYRDGLIEFLHARDGRRTTNEGRIGRFSHIGIVVPDVKAAEKRLESSGVPILKALGVDSIDPGTEVADWWNVNEACAVEIAAGVRSIHFGDILLVRDPDGNVVEVQERE